MSKPNVEIAAFVGLDWADQKHVVTLQEANSDQRGNASLWIRHRRRCRTGFNCCGIGSLVDPSLLLSSKSVER